jgi:hypothetical protein
VELASLVLSGGEYEEFRHAVEAHRPPRNT